MPLDQITKALVAEFRDEAGLPSQGDPKDFEKFVTYVTVAPTTDSPLDYTRTVGGDGNDTGLDAIAIIVNGDLVTDADDVDDLAESNTSLDVNFVFVQTETASGFSTQKIGQISYGVTDFFTDPPTLTRNEQIENAAEIARRLFTNARLFRNSNPTCHVFYATAGRWTGDPDLEARRAAAEASIEDLNLFSKVAFSPLGARDLQKRYHEVKSGIQREFTFPSRVALPEIAKISEAHLGYIPAPDLIELITDDDGILLPTIFYENVRDFQGERNAVNSEMKGTLGSAWATQFPILNNGVTIISKRLQQVGTKFIINDFQVVNGCQTCNVLWQNRANLTSEVLVPLRLISTDDEDTISSIIRATNRQTQVREEQFYATGDYLKHLEMYFTSMPADKKLYLERRSKQYTGSGIPAGKVIQFNSLVRSFASLLLDEPHRATRNYKALLERIPEDILNPNHKPSIYFAAASAIHRLDGMFRSGALEPKFSPARYHILMATRLIAVPRPPAQLNGREADQWAANLTDMYWDNDRADEVFQEAAAVVDELADGDFTRDKIRTLPFTNKVLEHFNSPVRRT